MTMRSERLSDRTWNTNPGMAGTIETSDFSPVFWLASGGNRGGGPRDGTRGVVRYGYPLLIAAVLAIVFLLRSPFINLTLN